MQRKIKRKFVALILAASLAVSSLAAFPMNVFAGTGKNGVIKAPNAKKVTEIFIFGYPANNIIDVGKNLTLTAAFFPPGAYADYKKVTWSSSSNDMAAEDIKLTNITDTTATISVSKPGTVTITATAKNGLGEDKSGEWIETSVEITVRPLATSITLNKSVLALNSDTNGVHEETLQATVLPEGADQTVTWSSDKPDVAEVDENGKVTAKALGEATITATTTNDLSATCKVYVCEVVVVKSTETPHTGVYVQDDIVVDPVKLTFSDMYCNMHDDDGWFRYASYGNFTLTVVPADGSNITITQCKFYHENSGQSSTSTDPTNFSCEAFTNGGGYYCITKVDVYFTRTAS